MPYNTNIPGWMTERELQTIESWAQQLPPESVIVEIGAFMGRSTVCWALSAPLCTVYAIDRFPIMNKKWYINSRGEFEIGRRLGNPLQFKNQDLQEFDVEVLFDRYTKGLNNIIKLKGDCPDEIQYPKNDIDLLFVDTAHEKSRDWNIISAHLPRLKPNARICGHDYDLNFPGTIEMVKKLEQMLDNPVSLYADTNLWSLQWRETDAL